MSDIFKTKDIPANNLVIALMQLQKRGCMTVQLSCSSTICDYQLTSLSAQVVLLTRETNEYFTDCQLVLKWVCHVHAVCVKFRT